MLMCCSIALENLLRTMPSIQEYQKIYILHAPFKGPTLFNRALAKLQKVSTERTSSLTVFPNPAVPSTTYSPQPYVGHSRSYKRGFSKGKRGQEPRWTCFFCHCDQGILFKDSQVLNVTVPQDFYQHKVEKPDGSPHPKHSAKGKLTPTPEF